MNPICAITIRTTVKAVAVSGLKELNKESLSQLRADIDMSLFDTQKFVDIDMSEIRAIDTAGIEVLIDLAQTLQSRNCRIRLVNPDLQIESMLWLAHVSPTFEIVRTSNESSSTFSRCVVGALHFVMSLFESPNYVTVVCG